MFGCKRAQSPVPELLSESLSALGGPVRISWYLSPELSDSEALRRADRLMADIVSASDSNGPQISAVVRPPEAGERQPGSLLPIPATDNLGKTVFLWSSLVLDWREHRVVIPDVWEPEWLYLDLARALQDLASGGPLSLGYLDGSAGGSAGGAVMPLTLLSGRWNPVEWHPETNSPNFFKLLMIHDGPELDSFGPALVTILDDYALQGGGVLVAAPESPAAASAVSEWARIRSSDDSTGRGYGRVLYAESDDIFNPESLRDLDTALLLAAGRIDLLAMMAAGTGEIRKPGSRSAGSRSAGSLLLKSAEKSRRPYTIDPDSVSKMAFSAEGTDIFFLEKSEGRWILVSGDWRLPARGDRAGSFLRRLQTGSEEIWTVTDNSALVNQDLLSVSTIGIQEKNGKKISLDFAGERPSGGGAYFLSGNSVALWPLIGGEEISGDARYWMERRLFPDTGSAIRVELRTDTRLYWRLHEEGDEYYHTDRNGRRVLLDSSSASDFLGRILRAEALTLAPAEEHLETPLKLPLKLMLEESSGRRIEYSLGDGSGGRVVAESEEGLVLILDDTLVGLILEGPESG